VAAATKTSRNFVIANAFTAAGRDARAAFIPYLMAGDPDLETTASMLAALGNAGADLIELGIPYGDPLADGPTIAAAGQRALARGTRIADVLALVRRSREAGAPPVVLFTYVNPVLQFGVERFARESSEAGAAGVIIPDVAFEETAELREIFSQRGLEMPLLVAPSTPLERAVEIARVAAGFVYVVSRLGVTGASTAGRFDAVRSQVESLRTRTKKPLAVGFGVSTAQHVREIASFADGVIVGSTLIDAYAGREGQDATRAVSDLVERLAAATLAAKPSP